MRSKNGPLHAAILPAYVKPNQLLWQSQLFWQSKREQSGADEDPVIFVQLVPDSATAGYIRYRIMDGDGIMGRWRDKGHKTHENEHSSLWSTKFLFTNGPNDLSLITLSSGEVQIKGYDATQSGNPPITWTSSFNEFDDDDVTWVQP
jgi:hypothetical protein